MSVCQLHLDCTTCGTQVISREKRYVDLQLILLQKCRYYSRSCLGILWHMIKRFSPLNNLTAKRNGGGLAKWVGSGTFRRHSWKDGRQGNSLFIIICSRLWSLFSIRFSPSFCFRRLVKRIQMVMERLILKNGRNSCPKIHLWSRIWLFHIWCKSPTNCIKLSNMSLVVQTSKFHFLSHYSYQTAKYSCNGKLLGSHLSFG